MTEARDKPSLWQSIRRTSRPPAADATRARLRLGRFRVPIPRRRSMRRILGWGLTAAGMLPIVGWGFLPMGLLLLSVDSASIRRWRRRMEIKWGRRRKKGRKPLP